MDVLIVGAGIAGPTLAYWLKRFGFVPTLVERAPRLREGGYVVDFWGAGYDVAERMGIVPRLLAEGYRFRELREVDARGRRISHLDPIRLIDAARGRYVTIGRSDLSRAVFDALNGDVETVFDDTVETLDDDGDRVHVRFNSGATRSFDLVIGADGLHSRVRALTFGPESDYERYLGIVVAAFDVDGYLPRDELVAVTHTEVGAQMLRIGLRDGSTMFCFMFRHDGDLPVEVGAQQKLLRSRIGGMRGEARAVLDRMPQARTFYMDRASQIRMPSWSRGRIGLVGDAAACPSLLAGQGAALAMVEAYVLAVELRRVGLHASPGERGDAFAAMQTSLAGLVREKQDAALGLGAAFAPRNRMQLYTRNTVLGLMGIPFVADLVMGRSLRDPIELPVAPL